MAGLIAIMFALNFVAMIFVDQIVNISVLRYLLSLLGTIIGVMQVTPDHYHRDSGSELPLLETNDDRHPRS
jgi:hypothetical protein